MLELWLNSIIAFTLAAVFRRLKKHPCRKRSCNRADFCLRWDVRKVF